MTSEVKNILEAYIHLIHTKQYYRLQCIHTYILIVLETSSAINLTGCWIANEHDDTAQIKIN